MAFRGQVSLAELTLPDHHRGMVEAESRVFVTVDAATCGATLALEGNTAKAAAPPPRDVVSATCMQPSLRCSLQKYLQLMWGGKTGQSRVNGQ